MISAIVSENRKPGFFKKTYGEFLTNSEMNMVFAYMLLYTVFSFGFVPKDILLLAIAAIFLFSSLKSSLIMYLFFTLWENVSVFSSGLTISLIFQILMVAKIIIDSWVNKKVIFPRISDLLFCIFIFFYGTMNYLVGTKGLAGIALAFDAFIAIYAFNIYRFKDQSSEFWKAVFFTILISTSIATLYGLMNGTSHDRWISGIGSVKQLYGTIGTARMGMYYCASLIFPFFYIKKTGPRFILCILFVLGAIMTYSITALICLIVFWAIVFIKSCLKNKNIKAFFLTVIPIGFLLFFWKTIRNIDLLKPFTIRLENALAAFQEGDVSAATSSRSYLMEVYLKDFSDYPILNKIFGSFYVNRYFAIAGYDWSIHNYGHNTFIDILLYSGIFGLIVFMIRVFRKVLSLKGREEFLPVVLMKIIFIITGFSVSMLTNSYWFMWFII